MPELTLKPTHKPVRDYYQVLGELGQMHIDHEMAVRGAFQRLLETCGRKFDWTLVPEFPIERPKGPPLRVDGALLDTFRLTRGFWEAKDEHDDLERKSATSSSWAIPATTSSSRRPSAPSCSRTACASASTRTSPSPPTWSNCCTTSSSYREPDHEEWDAGRRRVQGRICPNWPERVQAADRRTSAAPTSAFIQRFEAFYALCRQAINPNLSDEAVEEMLIQHLLTERIFRQHLRQSATSRSATSSPPRSRRSSTP